ncbi:MAG: LemA family protein [Alphaproteobacteria bacterium]|nr:LemA family protein [Alphaproteobacteria bacterium]MDY4689306.1 LemA family protein [Alphaproteobacteria bacterium]
MEIDWSNPWIIGGIAVVILFYAQYVRLISVRNKVKESAADIDVQLKKRYDLIPNMLQMAAKFMEHEKSLMTELTELRTKAMANTFAGAPKEKMELESLLNQKLNDFKVSLENYPDLKSNQTMIAAMQSMNEVEEHISAARRFYNSNVNRLKNAAEIFPGNIVAAMVGVNYKDTPFFEISEAERKPVNSSDYFK